MYHYTEGGLTNVWLSNGFREEDTPYGKGVSIEDIEGLHRAIGMKLVKERAQLTGAEFRFLRKELGLSQAKLAHWWGYEAQSVAGWEKRGRVPRIADRFIRAFYLEKVSGNPSVLEIVERLALADLADRMAGGNFGDCKPLSDGVWELRIDHGPGYRVYYAKTGKEIVLLLIGGDKRRQQADIETARSYWKDWQERSAP